VAELIEGPEEVEVERIVLSGPGGPVDAIHARPLGMPTAGVVLHPDILGIRPLFDELARRLATHGFAVCAPEPFWAVEGSARAALDAPTRLGMVADLRDDLQLGVLEAAADHLVVADDVPRVAVIGFCMGGMYAFKAAGTGRFERAVSCYGMVRVPDGWRGDHLAEPLDALAGACPVLAVFGGIDHWTPSADIDALRDALAAVPGSEVVVYPEADHGFVHDPDRPAHRADDAADVWSRVLAFLGG
jgi:carboxymethylenebutenolidase